jgi:UDP-N-acetylmuramate--alanine ligase
MKVLLAAAGTAGHVIPAISTAKELENLGYKPVFLGCNGIEKQLLADAGFDLFQIDKVPFERSPSKILKNTLIPLKISKLSKKVSEYIKQNSIKAVVVFGGYVSVPAILAAKSTKIPLIIHEQNSKVGMANKFGASRADFFAYSFPDTLVPSGAKGHSQCIGLPMRGVRLTSTLRTGPERLGPEHGLWPSQDDGGRHESGVLIFGGSLGAASINKAVEELLSDPARANEVLQKWHITHLTGRGKSEGATSVRDGLPQELQGKYEVLEYDPDLISRIIQADLVISRGGASTVHELAVLGKPAVIVPLPIGNGEQAVNGKFLQNEQGEGAIIVPDSDFTAEKISNILNEVTPEKLTQMSKIAQMNAKTGAATKLAKIVDRNVVSQVLKNYNNAHFMAISGAGIAPISTCFSKFSNVTGCDSLTGGHSAEHLKGQDVVVYSSAIKPHNPERQAAQQLADDGKIELLHRSDALDLLLRAHQTSITVAGSHGKTSITAMIGSILDRARGNETTYVIGAQATVNGKHGDGGQLSTSFNEIVAEADESDGSFQKYHPTIAVISNMEADHLDYYGDYEGVKKAFKKYVENSEFIVTTSEIADELKISGQNNVLIINESDVQNNKFDLVVPGSYNQVNAALSAAVARKLGISEEDIKQALEQFKGADRRFEQHQIGEYLIIDDYAHHPTEVQKLVDGAIEKFGNNEFVLLFQPHLYSRTRDFQAEFAKQISRAKAPIVTKIYKAREEQEDFLDVTPSTIAQHQPNIKTAMTIEDGLRAAILGADEIARESGNKKIILSVGAGPSLIDDFRSIIQGNL